MDDFKQNTKMTCEGSHYKKGGKVKKYAGDTDGSYVSTARAENALPKIQAESRKMQAEGIPTNPTRGQQGAVNMTNMVNTFTKKRFGPEATVGPAATSKRTGGSVKRKK
jgi:hypothetical protein